MQYEGGKKGLSKQKWMEMGLKIAKNYEERKPKLNPLQIILKNKSVLESLENIKIQVKAVKEENENFQKEYKKLKQQNNELELKLPNLQKEIQNLKEAIDRGNGHVRYQQSIINEQLAESEKFKKVLETKIKKEEELKRHIADAKDKAYELQVTCQKLNESISLLNDKIKESELIVNTNKVQFDNLSSKIGELRETRYQKEKQDEQLLKQKMDEVNGLNKEYKKISIDLSDLEELSDSLKKELSKKINEINQLEENLVELAESLHSYQKEYNQKIKIKEELTKVRQECEEEQKKTKKEHQELCHQSKQTEEQVANLEAAIKQLQEEVANQQKELRLLKKEKNKKKNQQIKNKPDAESKPSLTEMDKQPCPKDEWEKYRQDPQYITAIKYKTGDSKTAKDLNKAVVFFRKSSNNPLSRFELARCKEWGHGIKQNKTAAFLEYKALADAKQPYPLAQYHTGLYYFKSIGVLPKNVSRTEAEALAVEYFAKAAHKVPQAALEYAHCLENGCGVDVNLSLALEYYKLAQTNWTQQPEPHAIQASINRVEALIKIQEQDKQQKKEKKAVGTSKLVEPVQAKSPSMPTASSTKITPDEKMAKIIKERIDQIKKETESSAEEKNFKSEDHHKSNNIKNQPKKEADSKDSESDKSSLFFESTIAFPAPKDAAEEQIFKFCSELIQGACNSFFNLTEFYTKTGAEKDTDKLVDYYFTSFLKDGSRIYELSTSFLNSVIKKPERIIKAATSLTYAFLSDLISKGNNKKGIKKILKKYSIDKVYITTIFNILDYYVLELKVDNIDKINTTELYQKFKTEYEQQLTQTKSTKNSYGESSFWKSKSGRTSHDGSKNLENKDSSNYTSLQKG